MIHDHHSHAQPEEVRVVHMQMAWTVRFETRQLEGEVVLHLERTDPDAPLILDMHCLELRAVERGREGHFVKADPVVQRGDPLMGDALFVPLRSGDDRVRIRFVTAASANGLQWLTPAQTAGKVHPFLFSQAQCIGARSFVPCQDTPGVRSTWTARLTVPRGLRAVMGASVATHVGDDGGQSTWAFEMPHPIPSYLLALAVGELDFEPLGPRSGVYAEPQTLAAAAWEFADVEAMITTVEQRFGAYRWGRYDLLVMPPSFPLGGMENPCVTFASPTLLAGDRSLVGLIAHELAHSWTGNLVNNATWRDFWLNEGFTVFLEQRIVEVLYGHERYAMEVALGMDKLHSELQTLEPWAQVLHVHVEGRDPDSLFSSIPYDKGCAFLRTLEALYGRAAFDGFLRAWLDTFAFKAVTTAEFLRFLDGHLLSQDRALAAQVDLDVWLNEPGLPAGVPQVRSEAFAIVDSAVQALAAGAAAVAALDTAGWVTHQWLRLINGLGARADVAVLAALDARFGMTASANPEIAGAWLPLAVRSGYDEALPRALSFVLELGRGKLVKPIYRALMGRPELVERARYTFQEALPGYHPQVVRAVEAILSA